MLDDWMNGRELNTLTGSVFQPILSPASLKTDQLLFGAAAAVTYKAVEFTHDDGEEVALLPTGVKDLIKKGVDWTIRLKFQTRPDYNTGTIAATNGVVTLSGGVFPSWAADGTMAIGGTNYTVDSRDSDTQVTLDNTTSASNSSAGTSYALQYLVNEGLLAVTTGSADRTAIEITSTNSLRARVFPGSPPTYTAADGARSTTLSDRDAIHTLIVTWDADYTEGGPSATVGRTKAWVDGSEMSGSLSANVSGTTGGYLGSHSGGGDYGSIDTFTGKIWAFEVYNSTITATSDLDSLTPTREYKFTEKTSTTAEDDQGSGDEITLQNGAAFVSIPE